MIFTWCKYCSAVGRCMKFYGVFFCFFATARLNVINFHAACNILWLRRPGNKLDSRLKMAENTCMHNLFSLKSFCICAKHPKDWWVDRTFSKPKRKFHVIILSSKYSKKCKWSSIMIVDLAMCTVLLPKCVTRFKCAGALLHRTSALLHCTGAVHKCTGAVHKYTGALKIVWHYSFGSAPVHFCTEPVQIR